MKTAVNLSCVAGVSSLDLIPLVKRAGFDGCFSGVSADVTDVMTVASRLREEGLIYQSVHAPFTKMHQMWESGEDGENALAELIACAENAARVRVPIMVTHVFIGFREEHPNSLGVERFGKLVKRAEELGIKIAFENTEGESYLQAVRDGLFSSPAAGFCIDTGHEMCYNRSADMISKYGAEGKLFCTHLNDNMGITGPEIFWLDDAHLLPFDGIADWDGIAKRMKAVGYDGFLTLELTTQSKPNRTTHDRYASLSPLEFLTLAHDKALQFAEKLS
ncbi:MAG: sugar phosphate isomerase/epimerase [Clostridia bacterium]|nr:sugar phosphate isomerase/epimerase [Clostridia bacterium]